MGSSYRRMSGSTPPSGSSTCRRVAEPPYEVRAVVWNARLAGVSGLVDVRIAASRFPAVEASPARIARPRTWRVAL
jgi:hypothetical protein